MPAKLDPSLVRRLTDSFPNAPDWSEFDCSGVIRPNRKSLQAQWSSLAPLRDLGGVYAFLVPTSWFAATRTIKLHAPHTHSTPIPFEFTLLPMPQSNLGVVYVGRTTNLGRRLRFHLSRGKRKDGGQVKFGLMDCGVCSEQDESLRELRQHARVVYSVLAGRDHCANRDILEISVCARFAPPFNIKSER